jgi:hypothetical protein
MRSAFETLLEASHLTSHLRQRFSGHFSEEAPTPPVWGHGIYSEARWRERWPKNTNRPLDAWVQDFCNSRNAAAHGVSSDAMSSVWSTQNHLLFSAWLFPLMVKKVLANAGLYQLSDEDLLCRSRCEAFIAHDLLSRTGEDSDVSWWSQVYQDIQNTLIADVLFGMSSADD